MTTSLLSLFKLLVVLQVATGVPTGSAGTSTSAPSVSEASPQSAGGVSATVPTVSNGSSSSVSSAAGSGGVSLNSTPAPITLTLDEVVNIAVKTNTNVILAQQRFAESAENVNQINAQGLPQLNSNIADTYSTFAESAAAFGPVVTNPVVPTGTTIPTVVDDAADFTSGFGLGTETTSSSFGASVVAPVGTSGTGVTLPATDSSLPGSSSATALPGVNSGTSASPGTSSPTPGSSPTTSSGTTSNSTSAGGVSSSSGSGAGTGMNGSTGTSGTGSSPDSSGSTGTDGTSGTGDSTGPSGSSGASSSGSGASTSGTSFDLMPMPLILQNYVTEPSVPAVVASAGQSDSAADDVKDAPESKTAASAGSQSQSAGPRQAEQTTTVPVNEVSNNSAVNNYGARVNLSQFIDAFGLLGASKDVEKLTRDFYALDVDRNQNEVALSAKNLFFNVILAQQEVATDQEQVNDATESVRVTNALVTQGQAAGFDLLSAQTTLANDQQVLTAAKNQLSFAVADLDYLLGVNTGTQINLVPPALPSLTETVDLQQTTNVALQRRPEVIQANKNVDIARKLVKVASEGQTPSIGLVATYGYNSVSTPTDPTNDGLISAQVAIPFYDGGATRSRIREAKEVLQGQITTLNELKLSVALEVRQAYLNVLDGQTQASTAQSGVDLANETLRVANIQYQNGLGTILDVENAQAQLATARTNLANAQFTYQTALASLVRAIGSR